MQWRQQQPSAFFAELSHQVVCQWDDATALMDAILSSLCSLAQNRPPNVFHLNKPRD
jgi:hypothetical protein